MPISAALPVSEPSQDVSVSGGVSSVPPSLLAVGLAVSLLGLLTTNPWLTFGSLVTLPILVWLTWRPGEPPLLLFVVGFQWLQATAKVFHADLLGIAVKDLVLFASVEPPQAEKAIWLSLAGLVVIAVGIRLVLRRVQVESPDVLSKQVEGFSIPKAFLLYLALTVSLTAAYGVAVYIGPLRQIVLGILLLKWSGFYLLAYLVFSRKSGYAFFLAAFAIEFIGGIGFFSGFKQVIFVSVIAFFSVGRQLTIGTALKGFAVVALLGVLGLGWTSIKSEYRATISGGMDRQGSVVSQEEQINLLVDMVGDLSGEDLVEGLDPLLQRIAYVDFFGYVLNAVPSVVPHADGVQWAGAVRHVLIPRLVWPSKPPLVSDSQVTSQYTGIYVAGSEGDGGTSISIGYMGESYIDFGLVGMFVPIFLLGIGWGLIYLFFVRRADNLVLGYAYSVAVLMSAYQLEVAAVKLLGGVVMKLIVVGLIMRYTQSWLQNWLQAEEAYSEEEEPDGVYELEATGPGRVWGWRA